MKTGILERLNQLNVETKNLKTKRCVEGLINILQTEADQSHFSNLVNEGLKNLRKEDAAVDNFFKYTERKLLCENLGLAAFNSTLKSTHFYENDGDTQAFSAALDADLQQYPEYLIVETYIPLIKKYAWNNKLRNPIRLVEANLQKGLVFKLISEAMYNIEAADKNGLDSEILTKMDYAFHLPENDAKHYILTSFHESAIHNEFLAKLVEQIAKIDGRNLYKNTFVTTSKGRLATSTIAAPTFENAGKKYFPIGKAIFEDNKGKISKVGDINSTMYNSKGPKFFTKEFLQICEALSFFKQVKGKLVLEHAVGTISIPVNSGKIGVTSKTVFGTNTVNNNREKLPKGVFEVKKDGNHVKLTNVDTSASYIVYKPVFEDAVTNGAVETVPAAIELDGQPATGDTDAQLAELNGAGVDNETLSLLLFVKNEIGQLTILDDVVSLKLNDMNVEVNIIKSTDGSSYVNVVDADNAVDFLVNVKDIAKLNMLSQQYGTDLALVAGQATSEDMTNEDDEEAQKKKDEERAAKQQELDTKKQELSEYANNMEKIELLDESEKDEEVQVLYDEMKAKHDNLKEEIKTLESELNENPEAGDTSELVELMYTELEECRINDQYRTELEMNNGVASVSGTTYNVGSAAVTPIIDFSGDSDHVKIDAVCLQVEGFDLNSIQSQLQGTPFTIQGDRVCLGYEQTSIDEPISVSVKTDLGTVLGLIAAGSPEPTPSNEDDTMEDGDDKPKNDDKPAPTDTPKLVDSLQPFADELESKGVKIEITDEKGFNVDGVEDIYEIFVDSTGALKKYTGQGKVEDVTLDEIKAIPGSKPVNENNTGKFKKGDKVKTPDNGTGIVVDPNFKDGGHVIVDLDDKELSNQLSGTELPYKEEELELINENKDDKKKDKKGIEAYGTKGMKNTKWRKTFKSEEELNKWVEKNDATVEGTRSVNEEKETPIKVDDFKSKIDTNDFKSKFKSEDKGRLIEISDLEGNNIGSYNTEKQALVSDSADLITHITGTTVNEMGFEGKRVKDKNQWTSAIGRVSGNKYRMEDSGDYENAISTVTNKVLGYWDNSKESGLVYEGKNDEKIDALTKEYNQLTTSPEEQKKNEARIKEIEAELEKLDKDNEPLNEALDTYKITGNKKAKDLVAGDKVVGSFVEAHQNMATVNDVTTTGEGKIKVMYDGFKQACYYEPDEDMTITDGSYSKESGLANEGLSVSSIILFPAGHGNATYGNATPEYKELEKLEGDDWTEYLDKMAANGLTVEYDNVEDEFTVKDSTANEGAKVNEDFSVGQTYTNSSNGNKIIITKIDNDDVMYDFVKKTGEKKSDSMSPDLLKDFLGTLYKLEQPTNEGAAFVGKEIKVADNAGGIYMAKVTKVTQDDYGHATGKSEATISSVIEPGSHNAGDNVNITYRGVENSAIFGEIVEGDTTNEEVSDYKKGGSALDPFGNPCEIIEVGDWNKVKSHDADGSAADWKSKAGIGDDDDFVVLEDPAGGVQIYCADDLDGVQECENTDMKGVRMTESKTKRKVAITTSSKALLEYRKSLKIFERKKEEFKGTVGELMEKMKSYKAFEGVLTVQKQGYRETYKGPKDEIVEDVQYYMPSYGPLEATLTIFSDTIKN